MDRQRPTSGSTAAMSGQVERRQGLEYVPPNSRRVDMHIETQLKSRLRNVYPVPGQDDEKIRLLLQRLAAKLREEPPA
jgi:hypothetical protein